MNYTICSRESVSDYAWDNTYAPVALAKYARSVFTPALEGSLTASRFVVLMRSPTLSNKLILGVSVSTTRIDFRNRPIRTVAFLEAANSEEERILMAFFTECLYKPDAGTIYDAESSVAKAVESIYQRKRLDEFLEFCRNLSNPTITGCVPKGQMEFPRTDMIAREDIAKSISELIRSDSPFLIVLTDRATNDMLKDVGNIFNRGVIRIFSKQVKTAGSLKKETGLLQKNVWAAAIGVVVLIVLAAAIKSCSRDGERDETVDRTSSIFRAGDLGRSSVDV